MPTQPVSTTSACSKGRTTWPPPRPARPGGKTHQIARCPVSLRTRQAAKARAVQKCDQADYADPPRYSERSCAYARSFRSITPPKSIAAIYPMALETKITVSIAARTIAARAGPVSGCAPYPRPPVRRQRRRRSSPRKSGWLPKSHHLKASASPVQIGSFGSRSRRGLRAAYETALVFGRVASTLNRIGGISRREPVTRPSSTHREMQ